MNKKILLIDDESDIVEFISYNLKHVGFEVFSASNGPSGIELAKKHKPDLILLDVMMPQMDGIETCYEIRKTDELKQIIVVFLSARNEDFSQIAAFDSGANDYINKPIKPKLLIKKIQGLLQISISNKEIEKNTVQFESLKIDHEAYKITFEEKEFELPKKEFELLSLMASNPNKVFKRDEILDSVWGNDVVVGDRTIDVHIRKLREKLGNDKIITIKGVGYKINVN
jgi:two-component system, OmpR family, alkaline phosphatase synthesis response regulator PhoP